MAWMSGRVAGRTGVALRVAAVTPWLASIGLNLRSDGAAPVDLVPLLGVGLVLHLLARAERRGEQAPDEGLNA